MSENEEIRSVRDDAIAREHLAKHITFAPGESHLVLAGAGSGKTTVLLSIAERAEQNGEKVLILAYNTAIRDEISQRITMRRGLVSNVDQVVGFCLPGYYTSIPLIELDTSDTKPLRKVGISLGLWDEEKCPPLGTVVERLRFALAFNTIAPGDEIVRKLLAAALTGAWSSFEVRRFIALTTNAFSDWVRDNGFTVLLVDEAQDLNKAFVSLVDGVSDSACIFFMGDFGQKIYGFNHAVELGAAWPRPFTRVWNLYLTFRFGKSVCDYVNQYLLGAQPTYAAPGVPDTSVTFLTNSCEVEGNYVYLHRWWSDLFRSARTIAFAHPDTMLTCDGVDVAPSAQKRIAAWKRGEGKLPRWIQEFTVHGVEKWVAKLSHVPTKEELARKRVISLRTLHSYKGLEAGRVRVHEGLVSFPRKELERDISNDDTNCFYVAVTRARNALFLETISSIGR